MLNVVQGWPPAVPRDGRKRFNIPLADCPVSPDLLPGYLPVCTISSHHRDTQPKPLCGFGHCKQASSRWGDCPAQFMRSLYPFLDDHFCVGNGLLAGFTISHATRQVGNFDQISLIFIAPVNHHLIFLRAHYFSLSNRWERRRLRTCLTWYGFARIPTG